MISRRRLLNTTAATAIGTALTAASVPAARASGPAQTAGAPVRITTPTVEYATRPLGLGVARPRLSWPLASSSPEAAQTAYRLRVATDPQRLGNPDVWDSGKVASADSVLVEYAGPELASRTRYYWSVRVWDDRGKASAWSEPSWWETGLFAASDWSAQWIGAPAALTGTPALDDASWIWFPEGIRPPAHRLPRAGSAAGWMSRPASPAPGWS
ncbi:hypothetical protein NKH18_04000 [Streptomyces sp. M10(2022)]